MTLGERWGAFSTRERVMVGAAGVLAIVVVGYYGLRGSFDEVSFDGGDERWAQVQKIRNYRRIIARLDSEKTQGDKLGRRYQGQQKRLMGGATPTQVGAELQGMLSSSAGEAGLNVLSSQILRVDEEDGFRRVGVRLTLSGTVDGVTSLLSDVEGNEHDLVVTVLDINRKLGASRRTMQKIGTSAVSPLTVSMEVRTFLREGVGEAS